MTRVAGLPRHGEPHPLGPTTSGSVLLDIGGADGALVVRTDDHTVGLEVEIRRQGEPWTGRHVAVREREVAGTTFAAALFGPLPEARYELRWRDRRPAEGTPVVVRAGSVGEVGLPRAMGSAAPAHDP
ncbi:MAG: phospholipase [Acidobacteriota bacterium]|nr:phospholipase [Acidobacteriota bacterium]